VESMGGRHPISAVLLMAGAGAALLAVLLFFYAPMIWFGNFDPLAGMLLSLLAFLVAAPLAVIAILQD